MNLKDLITPKELARKLGVTERIVFEWRKEGMPTVKIGKSVFIVQESFLRWIEKLEKDQNAQDASGDEI